ncbi:adenine-specific DNA-methyltransferase [Mucilaginibacter sp. OAE612]|uniref:site-specific DNA-methyltransferase n=1 Tax=Mucilaginibacter sp. OAE612 TaxID=3156444 RepID=UPI00359D08F1
MDGKSFNITTNLIAQLKNIIPAAFTEDKLDIEQLKQLFGENVNTDNERYQLNWAGKNEAYKVLQLPTTATLIPDKINSLNWETTENIFIEGENLEALKILQKAYYGKVKAICIDPPYNTGYDSFIYPDKFSETKEEYARRVRDKDEDGLMMKEGLFRQNKKENGQFHSNWLSMMLPRLFLAKNLLCDDGVIFINIDDNELANLKLLMDEVFGEENKEAIITWRRRHNQPNDKSKMISKVAEYILVYAKNSEALKRKNTFYGLPLSDARQGSYSNPDNDPLGPWDSKPWKAGSGQSGSRYKIKTPTGKVLDEEWMGAETTYAQLLAAGKIYFPSGGDGWPRKKFYLSERMAEGQCAHNFWGHQDFGSNQEGSAELAEIFNGKNVFDNPKPTKLLKALIKIATGKDDIILDFFGGSGSTAHAIYELNEEEGANRKFILVQLPEKISESEEAYKYGFRTIAEVTSARLTKIVQQHNEQLGKGLNFDKTAPVGFRYFRLADSNFKIWRGDFLKTEADIVEQLQMFNTLEKQRSSGENMSWEIAIKNGVRLSAACSVLELTNDRFYYYPERELIIGTDAIESASAKEVINRKPATFICLDSIFKKNDKDKTNIQLLFEDAGITFHTI